MEKKLRKIIGLKKTEFDQLVSSGEIKLRRARLIPLQKPGDEMALTSVILSSVRLVKEFRKIIFSSAKIPSGGQVFVFTEVIFSLYPDSRVDGLLLVVSGGTIKDAAIFEMKNGNDELNKEQMEKYIRLAKDCSIPKVITISNQFVSEPTQCPINVRCPKGVALYHFSWSYLLTIAHILLFDNETNIGDKDQVEIMKEVVSYLENKKSGVCGFNQMKEGWKEVIEGINAGKHLKFSDINVNDTVLSWQQEEKDMSLILSRKLGVFVSSGDSKYKNNLMLRLEDDKKKLINNKVLTSVLRVKRAISDISVTALLEKRIVEMAVALIPPHDKKMRGQLGWIKRQLKSCKKRNEKIFSKINNEILIEVVLKRTNKTERKHLNDFDSVYDEIKDREIKEFRILLIKDFGKSFASRSKFVEMIEAMLVNFYKGIIQDLTKWEAPAPKIIDRRQIAEKGTQDEAYISDSLEEATEKPLREGMVESELNS